MATSFLDIYTSAITEFQDPDLKSLYANDIILFSQVMGNFMTNAISLFSRPMGVRKRLAKKKSPYLIEETFFGDSIKDKFDLNHNIPSEDVDDSLFAVKTSDGKINVEYDSSNNCIILPRPIPLGEKFVFIDYFVGSFENDLYDEEIYILSQWLMVCWSEYVQNNRLDIDRLLGDTDFKLTSNGPTTTSKTNWYIVNRETVMKHMMNYAWECENTHRYK